MVLSIFDDWYSAPFVKNSQKTVKTAKMTIGVPIVTCLPRLYQQCTNRQQELSYRKQVARQLRTQYVEGIHKPKYYTVTLTSRLRVTQGHWTGQIIHDLLLVELFDVKYYRDFEMWSLKVIDSGTVWKRWYGFLFAFHSNYGYICSDFADIQRQRMAWHWNRG